MYIVKNFSRGEGGKKGYWELEDIYILRIFNSFKIEQRSKYDNLSCLFTWLFQYIEYSDSVFLSLFCSYSCIVVCTILQSLCYVIFKKGANHCDWLVASIFRESHASIVLSTYGLAATSRALWLARCVTSSVASRIASDSIHKVNGSRRGRSDSKIRSASFSRYRFEVEFHARSITGSVKQNVARSSLR